MLPLERITTNSLLPILRSALADVEMLKLATAYGDYGKRFDAAHQKAIQFAAEVAEEWAKRTE